MNDVAYSEVAADEAVERIAGAVDAPLALSCEHASAQLPAPWAFGEQDRWLEGTHWAYDLGAAELTRALAARLGAPAVLSRFSRLLVDPNRPEDAPTLIRSDAEGKPIALNAAVSARERRARLGYWRAYHRAFDQMLRGCRAPVVLAIHSFTPCYEGARREVDVGVLFDREEALARSLCEALAPLAAAPHHLALRFNEPYSGKQGLIYSAARHAGAHGRRAVEIEVRNDHLTGGLMPTMCDLLAAWADAGARRWL